MPHLIYLIESQYCPPIETFHLLKSSGSVIWDVHKNYVKGSYRNRCHIVSSHGVLRLSIPLKKGKHQRLPLHQVEISYDEDWQKQHWQSIVSNYNRSPYFEFYKDDFEQFFSNNYQYLVQLNQHLIDWFLQKLNLKIEQTDSSEYLDELPKEIIDCRDIIVPITNWQEQKSYQQVFSDRQPFHGNMSIMDLLFNEGPQSEHYF